MPGLRTVITDAGHHIGGRIRTYEDRREANDSSAYLPYISSSETADMPLRCRSTPSG